MEDKNLNGDCKRGPCNSVAKKKKLRGLSPRAKQIYLYDVQCFDHCIAQRMYVTFSAKGLIMVSTADFIMPVTVE